MQSLCEQVIRCLCSCLIKKAQVPYNDVNEQHNEFIKLGDQVDEDHRLNRQQKQYIGSPTTLTVANKLSNYLEEDNKISTNSLQSKQIANTSTISTISKKQPLLELQNQSSKTYMNVIPQDHPYYHLFKQKLVDLEHIFQVPPQACVAEPEAAYPLKMHCFQDGKLNCFKYFYRFPTDYHTYEAISNDFQLQKQFDPNIDEFRKVLQTPGGDAKLIYLSYKKVLIMSSRDFQYVRYTFKKDNEYWNICISDTSRQQVKGKVRGQMLLTATRIIEHSGEIEVSVSSTTDMKIPIKLQIAKNRGFAEIRKYLDRVYQHIKEDQGKSII